MYTHTCSKMYVYTYSHAGASSDGASRHIYAFIYVYTHMYTHMYKKSMFTHIHTQALAAMGLHDTSYWLSWHIYQVHMGWLRLLDSLKLQVSFPKEPYKRDDILQKRPTILRSLRIVATPYQVDILTKVVTFYIYVIQRLEQRVATTCRLLKIIGLFCRIQSLLQGSFEKETYNFKESSNRSHPPHTGSELYLCYTALGIESCVFKSQRAAYSEIKSCLFRNRELLVQKQRAARIEIESCSCRNRELLVQKQRATYTDTSLFVLENYLFSLELIQIRELRNQTNPNRQIFPLI